MRAPVKGDRAPFLVPEKTAILEPGSERVGTTTVTNQTSPKGLKIQTKSNKYVGNPKIVVREKQQKLTS